MLRFIGVRRRTHVAFLTSALSTKDYFGLLVHSLALELRQKDLQLQLVPPLVDYEHGARNTHADAVHQADLLKRSLDDRSMVATVVAPIHPDALVDVVSDYARHGGRRLVVFDLCFSREQQEKFAASGFNPPMVRVDGEHGGRLAAQLLLASLERSKVAQPWSVHILAGTHARERWDAFVTEARAKGVTDLTVSLPIPFDRDRAREHCQEEFATKLLPSGFFCCNDEMALGVRDYLVSKALAGATERPRIVGFDGIPAMKSLIERKDPFVVGTVDVDVWTSVAGHLADIIDRLARDEQNLDGTQVTLPVKAYVG